MKMFGALRAGEEVKLRQSAGDVEGVQESTSSGSAGVRMSRSGEEAS